MNKKLAAGSGVGLIVGAIIGVIVDTMLGANGMTIVLGATFGISLGAGVAAFATNKKDSDHAG